MPRVNAILFSTAHFIALACAFNQSATTTFRWRPRNTGRREQTARPRPPTRLRLAKRGATPAKKSRQKKRRRSLASLLELETDLRGRGHRYVIGSDDSGGAGCVAGPVVVASCCLLRPHSAFLPIATSDGGPSSGSLVSRSEMDALSEVNDCKELTPARRREIYDAVCSHPDIFAVSIAQRSAEQIDEANLARATQEAFAESIETLVEEYDLPFDEVYAIVDGKVSPKLYASQRRKQSDAPVESQAPKIFSVRPYVNGDANVYTVALASIVARVARDAMMQELDERFPMYGFSNHSGYGRRDHIEAIHRLGSLEGVHRMSFKQVKGR